MPDTVNKETQAGNVSIFSFCNKFNMECSSHHQKINKFDRFYAEN